MYFLFFQVERCESGKNKSLIFVIKFFLSNENPRLNKVKRLLVERSKWFLNRVMSMTPQLREFSALSSLNDIPVLPVILNPVSCTASYPKSGKTGLDKLAHPMREVLKSSYNDSQLQAVSIAIGSTSSKTKCDLSLIQGPPGLAFTDHHQQFSTTPSFRKSELLCLCFLQVPVKPELLSQL